MLLNQTEFANHIGKAKSYITKLKQAGQLVMVDDKVDVEPSIALIEQNRDHNRDDVVERWDAHRATQNSEAAKIVSQDEKTANAAIAFNLDRARKMKADAQSAELDYKKAEGSVMETVEVRAIAANAGAILRTQLERIPDQIAPELSVEHNEERIHALLADHIEHALSAASRAINSKIEEVTA